MRKFVALVLLVLPLGSFTGTADAGGWHRHVHRPVGTHFYWQMTRREYAEWEEFGLFKGSWGERHRIVRRYPRNWLVVEVSRRDPELQVRCRWARRCWR